MHEFKHGDDALWRDSERAKVVGLDPRDGREGYVVIVSDGKMPCSVPADNLTYVPPKPTRADIFAEELTRQYAAIRVRYSSCDFACAAFISSMKRIDAGEARD